MVSIEPQASLRRKTVSLMALACGVSVANVYFPQAITPLIASGLHTSPGSTAIVATVTQLGYAAGIFFLVPLGDRVSRRPLVVILLTVTAAGLLIAGTATSRPVLIAASVLVGAATVVPQVLIPMAAGLAGEARRGAVVGTLQGGLIGGVLLARTFGGTFGSWLGWRAPYLIAAVLSVALAATLARAAPVTASRSRERYLSLVAVSVRLLFTEPELRRSAAYQATLFAGFSASWTCLALLITGPTYNLSTSAVGLIALLGAVSMFFAPAAGRWADRWGPDRINVLCIAAAAVAAGVLVGGRNGGASGIVILVLGMILLDVAVQCNQVANQARIFALRPEIHSRLNTAYMACSFLGGSAGSWLGVHFYERSGWSAVCVLLAVLTALAAVAAVYSTVRGRRSESLRSPAGPMSRAAEGIEVEKNHA